MSSNSRKRTLTVTTRRRTHRMAPVRRGGKKSASTAQESDPIVDNPEGRLLMSNIGSDVCTNSFDDIFGEFGKVIKVVIHRNVNDVPIGTAEVWMSTSAEANKAKTKLNATDIFGDGRIIRIERVKLFSKASKFWKLVFDFVWKVNAIQINEE